MTSGQQIMMIVFFYSIGSLLPFIHAFRHKTKPIAINSVVEMMMYMYIWPAFAYLIVADKYYAFKEKWKNRRANV